jgi:hypothetical protein
MFFSVQSEAFSRHVLYRDCSVGNCMIEDGPDGPKGCLIDWERAVETTVRGQYDMIGTVRCSHKLSTPSRTESSHGTIDPVPVG